MPEPVGPVTRMIPFGCASSFRTMAAWRSLRSSRSNPNCCCPSRVSRRRLMLSPFTVGIVETRTSMFEVPCCEIDAAILRQPALGDVHVRHHFQAREDRRLKKPKLRRHGNFVEDAVDAVADAQIVFERLDVDVGGALVDGFADDLVHELDDRGLGVSASMSMPARLRRRRRRCGSIAGVPRRFPRRRRRAS